MPLFYYTGMESEHWLFAIYWTTTEYYFNQAFGDEPTFLITCFGFGIENKIFAVLSCVKSATSDSRIASYCHCLLTSDSEAK